MVEREVDMVEDIMMVEDIKYLTGSSCAHTWHLIENLKEIDILLWVDRVWLCEHNEKMEKVGKEMCFC